MAWQSHGTDQQDLVRALKENNLIMSKAVEGAMLLVDRRYYAKQNPYEDSPQKIGFGATVSAPHMHAIALESLCEVLSEGAKVLDIGSGSGYLTACFAIMVGKTGKVVGVEHVPELSEQAEQNVSMSNPNLIANDQIVFVVADGREGWLIESPYDAIHVGAAAEKIHTQLTEQLKPGGRMILPVGPRFGPQELVQVDKSTDDTLVVTSLRGVRFVPLTCMETQLTGRTDIEYEYKGNGSIEMLVDDTLLHIFSYLSLKTWLKIEPVSKRWNILVKQQWHTLQTVEINELVEAKPIRFCEIQYFTPTVKEKLIWGLAARCGYVLKALLCGCKVKLQLSCLETLSTEFRMLEILDLSGAIFVWGPQACVEDVENSECHIDNLSIPHMFAKIHTLKLDNCFDDSSLAYHNRETIDSLLFKIFSSMPVVKHVSLSANTLLNGSCLLSLNSEIEYLDLSFCRRTTSDNLAHVFKNLCHLKHLSLYSCYKLTGPCLENISFTVENVDFSFCNELDAANLCKFMKTHTALKCLKLAHVKCLTDTVLAAVAHLKHLMILDISCYYKYFDFVSPQHTHQHELPNGLMKICGITSLQTLTLNDNDFVTDDHLYEISRACQQLEELNLSKLYDCTSAGFSNLGNLHNVKRLDLSENDCVDEAVLLSIAHGSCLELVNVNGCAQITERGLKRMGDLWPNKTTIFQIY